MPGVSQEHKRRLVAAVERHTPFWKEMALRIHAHPELALHEEQACAWLSEALRQAGFAVEVGVAGMPTSFLAVKKPSAGKPVIAFFAEYDAMPETGHSCGHNLIAAAACLAGQALAEETDAEVRIVGSPAEESYGGKIQLLEQGALAGIDFALLAHGGFMNLPNRDMLGRQEITLEFRGRKSSAGLAPHLGLNALDAMILTFNGVALMRQQLHGSAKISGIITHGGEEPHFIPDYTRAQFLLRTPEANYMDELQRRFLNCAQGAATATGTTVDVTVSTRNMRALKRNAALEAAYENNLRFSGEEVGHWPSDAPIGSTDFGNVSHAIPGVHAYFKMVPREVKHHTPEYAEASKSAAGLAGMVSAAKALALTGLDLAADAALRESVREDFRKASAAPEGAGG
jgi:amidohydrolase